VAQPERDRAFHVGRDGAAPPGQSQRPEGTSLGQGNTGSDVGHLVKQEREADLGLGHAELGQVEVDHRLAELGQAGAGGLRAIAVRGAEVMLASAGQPTAAARVVGDLLRRGERIPGFGHFIYKTGDPRAVSLIDMLRKAAPGSERLAVVEAALAEARKLALPEPNIDFALAALAAVTGMIGGAGEAIFAVARAAGWLAHALEEYARNTPIRPRGIYTGPAAASS